MKRDLIAELKTLPSPKFYAMSYTLLHEAGHFTMMKILRLPILKKNVNFHNKTAYITYIPRNPLDILLVALAGIFYPPIAMLKYARKAPSNLKVDFIRLAFYFLILAFYDLIYIRREHLPYARP